MVTAKDNQETIEEAEKMTSKKISKKLCDGKNSYRDRRNEYLTNILKDTPEHLVAEKVLKQRELLTKSIMLKMIEEQRASNVENSDFIEGTVGRDLHTSTECRI